MLTLLTPFLPYIIGVAVFGAILIWYKLRIRKAEIRGAREEAIKRNKLSNDESKKRTRKAQSIRKNATAETLSAKLRGKGNV